MRKLISASKRKWVLGGILGFAAVALTTTGFATWIVGVQRTKQDNQLSVSVDSATNNSVVLTAELSDYSISLQETETITNGAIVNTGELGADYAHALEITFRSITIERGKDYTFDFNQLTFEFGTINNETKDVVPESHTTTTSLLGTKSGESFKREGSSWTYIECPTAETISTSSAVTDESTGIKTLTITNKTVAFRWGTFFGSVSPAKFYNDKFDGQSLSTLTKASGEIEKELAAMYKYFTTDKAGKINVVLSLSKSK